ncbi:MAG: hypothetical protein ABIR65_12410 [Pseudolysinimonas sp.]
MTTATMTGSTATQNGYAAGSQIHGIAGIAVRLGRALQVWGQHAAEPVTREQQQLRIAIEREARASIVSRGDAHSGMYQLMR